MSWREKWRWGLFYPSYDFWTSSFLLPECAFHSITVVHVSQAYLVRITQGARIAEGALDDVKAATSEGMELCNKLRDAGAEEEEDKLREVVIGLIQGGIKLSA